MNKLVGKPTQVAFGSFSIVRIFDYFPSATDPELAVSVAWLEDIVSGNALHIARSTSHESAQHSGRAPSMIILS